MLRYYIQAESHSKAWFDSLLRKSFKTKVELAALMNISVRSLTDWQRAKYGIPQDKFHKLEQIVPYLYGDVTVKEGDELKRISGRLGGLVRGKKGYPLGNIESRRRGGYASLVTHKLRKTGFFLLKECQPFPHTLEAAELVGVIIGDGHLARGQIEITLDARERPYAQHVQDLFRLVTGYNASLHNRTKTVLGVYLSGKMISAEFNKLGVEYGNKTKKQNSVPRWIVENKEFCKAFIRGIFDTDGCLYADQHVIRNISYRHLGVALSASNPRFLNQVRDIMVDLGFHPTMGTKNQVRLRNQKDVQSFVTMVRPENQKHLIQYGRVNN